MGLEPKGYYYSIYWQILGLLRGNVFFLKFININSKFIDTLGNALMKSDVLN
jgi:hypothetical protein